MRGSVHVTAQQQTSEGCDFWAIKTDLIPDGAGACFAAYVANTLDSAVHIGVEYDNQTLTTSAFTRVPQGQGTGITYGAYDDTQGLAAGQVAILLLSRGPGSWFSLPDCPAPAAFAQDLAVAGTGRGFAFHITTDKPVAAYHMLPYGSGNAAATSATLLLPTSVWTDKYLAINAYAKSQVVSYAYPSLDILAREDNTVVTITPKAAIEGGTNVAAAPANQPAQYNLNRGEYVQFSQTAELTGSEVTATHPIAVFGAASCLNVPVTAVACDSAHQQIPPISALGNRYAGVRYKGRGGGVDEAPPWRLVGAVDGTVLTWTPAAPAGAPAALNAGQVAEFNSAGPFVVASRAADHPFYLASYMTGGDSFGGEGDPEWVPSRGSVRVAFAETLLVGSVGRGLRLCPAGWGGAGGEPGSRAHGWV